MHVYDSAATTMARLDKSEVSAVELIDAAIARIERLDARHNAVAVRDFERARAAAKQADAARAKGERRPLLGLPMTVKEAFHVQGLPTTWGLPEYKDWKAPEDAVTVARLKAAGAIILGKTNVPVNLADWQSHNPVYGITRNPWNPDYTPGGSSGGAAAALAAGYVALEIGSDIGGSIRVPAHMCGVFGHKPTYGLVPQHGHALPGRESTPDLNCCGPLARTAADLELALGILAGPDGEGEAVYHPTLPAPRHQRLAEYRVLVIDSHPLVATRRSVTDPIHALADRLEAKGVEVGRSSHLVPDLRLAGGVYIQLLAAVGGGRMSDEARAHMRAEEAKLGKDDESMRALRIRTANLPHHLWLALDEQRARIRLQWRALFQEWDVVLAPPLSVEAFPHNLSTDQQGKRIDIDGREITFVDQLVWPGLATLTGQPSTCAPLTRTAAGLPVGVQIMGGLFDDRTTIHFAHLIEQEFGGFTPPPGLD